MKLAFIGAAINIFIATIRTLNTKCGEKCVLYIHVNKYIHVSFIYMCLIYTYIQTYIYIRLIYTYIYIHYIHYKQTAYKHMCH